MNRRHCENPDCKCDDPYQLMGFFKGHYESEAAAREAGPPKDSAPIPTHSWRLHQHRCGHWAWVETHCEREDMASYHLEQPCFDCWMHEG